MLLRMLDTEGAALDIAAVIRVARRSPARAVFWGRVRVDVDLEGEVIVVDDSLEIDIERVPVRVPSTGRFAPGPVFARCPRGCGRRARVLWLDETDPELFLVCRACADVRYATASTGSAVERARIAYERLRSRLGLERPWQPFEPRPYERRAAYQRRAERLEQARERLRLTKASAEAQLLRQIKRTWKGRRKAT